MPKNIEDAKREGGFIKYIVLFLFFAGLLVYFGIDLRGFIEDHPEIAIFLHSVGTFAVNIWQEYFWPFLKWIWEVLPIE